MFLTKQYTLKFNSRIIILQTQNKPPSLTHPPVGFLTLNLLLRKGNKHSEMYYKAAYELFAHKYVINEVITINDYILCSNIIKCAWLIPTFFEDKR